MKILGIVGGIASGKSAVAKLFSQLGAVVIQADAIGHAVLEEDVVIRQAVERWGSEVLQTDGQLDRRQIAQRVFGGGSESEMEFWERCTHPRIKAEMVQQLDGLRDGVAPPPAVILDAALLFEAGWSALCDAVVFVDVPRDLRFTRVQNREGSTGWTRQHFEAREAAQLEVDEKRRRADFVIDNSATLDQTYKQVKRIWDSLID